jgi:hypothetical protein
MRRLSVVLLAAFLSLGLVSVLMWRLAYRPAPPPARVQVPGLSATAQINWTDEGLTRIVADSEEAAVTALGYAHGWRYTWAVTLWRQAALGRLGAWLGAPAVPVDGLIHQLGIPDDARTAYATLPATERAWLDAYGRGMARALQSPAPRLCQELVLLDVTPERWEPWHTIAIERLLSWLSSPFPALPDSVPAPPAVDSLRQADQTLRRWLQLYGFEHSIAWVARDTTTTHLVARYQYGGTALPLLTEVTMQWKDGPRVSGATVPGTPYVPMAETDEVTWALLWRSTRSLSWRPRPAAIARGHHRILLEDGTEQLVTSRRTDQHLILSTPSPREISQEAVIDSVLTLDWSGFRHGTDATAWRALLRGGTPQFQLSSGDGVRLDTSDTWTVTGRPLVSVTFPDGTFVGASPWSRYAAQRLQTLMAEEALVDPASWSVDTQSPWASLLAPALLDALSPPVSPTPAFEEALTYLLNWDFAYDRPSIGASLFEMWLTTYQSATGTLPRPPSETNDTLRVDHAALTTALEAAVDTLEAQFGSNMSRWRWERVQPERWRFPLWGSTATHPTGLESQQRFAPLELPNAGHPTTLAWGSTPILPPPTGPASWTAWTSTAPSSWLTVRRRLLTPEKPLDRYLTPHHLPRPRTLADLRSTSSTLLIPPSQ